MNLKHFIFDTLYRLGLDRVLLAAWKRLPAEAAAYDRLLRFYCYSRRLQTTPEEIRVVMSYVTGARSALVFGLGRDTPVWITFGPRDIVFLEDNTSWIRQNARFVEHVVQVSYGTRRCEYRQLLEQERELQMDVPDKIRNRCWDVIFVDAPNGYLDDHPGRMKSIYMASRLVCSEGVVLVHDIDRPVERLYAERYLGKRLVSVGRLAVFEAAVS